MDKDKKDKKENSIELIKKRKDSKKEALERMKKELGMKAGGIAGSLVPKTVKKLKNIMGAANRDRGKDKAEKKGGTFFTMDEMMPLKTLTSKGPGELKQMAKGGRAGLRGGGICKRGMNRKAIGKNS